MVPIFLGVSSLYPAALGYFPDDSSPDRPHLVTGAMRSGQVCEAMIREEVAVKDAMPPTGIGSAEAAAEGR